MGVTVASLNSKMLIFALIAAGSVQAQVRVGVFGPMTGGSAQMGTSMRNGARLAAEQINAAGGVLGQQIEAARQVPQVEGKEVPTEHGLVHGGQVAGVDVVGVPVRTLAEGAQVGGQR